MRRPKETLRADRRVIAINCRVSPIEELCGMETPADRTTFAIGICIPRTEDLQEKKHHRHMCPGNGALPVLIDQLL